MARKPTKKSARDRARKAMSQYIRQKYADRNGYVKCVSCGKVDHWKEMDAGHFRSKGNGSGTEFVEENVHPQCVNCNRFIAEDAKIRYTTFMIDTYGREKIEELEAQARQVSRRRVHDYLCIEAYYKERLEALLGRHNGDISDTEVPSLSGDT